MKVLKIGKKITIFNYKHGKWFNFYIENPLRTWNLAKKYFKRPKISFKIHRVKKYYGYPYASYNWLSKILDINIHDVEWKDKYDSPRYEKGPLIYICLFRLVAIAIQFHIYYFDEFGEKCNGDMEYWEYLLEWLHYKNKKTFICYSNWTRYSRIYKEIEHYGKVEDGSDDIFVPSKYTIPCVAMSLNKQGIKELKRELNEQGRNSEQYQIFS